jgi:hypothetical protein
LPAPRKTIPAICLVCWNGELGAHHVRELGLAAGFVDYKVAGINADWSALKFATRKSAPRASKKKKGAG